MIRLLKIEFIKVKSYRTVWAILGIYAALLALVTSLFGMSAPAEPYSTYFSFPGSWVRLANTAWYLNILTAILIIMLIANEYTFRTFRQNVIDGLSRAELIFSKIILICLIALSCITFIIVWGLARGLIDGHFDKFSQIFEEMPVLFRLFIQMVGYMSLAALAAVVFKRAAISLLMYLVYVVAVEPIIRWRSDDEIDRYFPMKVFNSVVPDTGALSLQGFMDGSPLSPEMSLLLACAYIIAFFGACYLLMEKSDL